MEHLTGPEQLDSGARWQFIHMQYAPKEMVGHMQLLAGPMPFQAGLCCRYATLFIQDATGAHIAGASPAKPRLLVPKPTELTTRNLTTIWNGLTNPARIEPAPIGMHGAGTFIESRALIY